MKFKKYTKDSLPKKGASIETQQYWEEELRDVEYAIAHTDSPLRKRALEHRRDILINNFERQRAWEAAQEAAVENAPSDETSVAESVEDMDKRCEVCNTLLNDMGTCPKCDDGEEDLKEELSVREKLKRAYPELNFDTPVVTEEVVTEELSNKEKLLRAFPELNFDTPVKESCDNVTEEIDTSDNFAYDDDYDVDDVELDRRHAALYGGDRMYCDCGHKLSHNEYGAYCPVCEPHDPESVYEENTSVDSTMDEYDDNM